MIEIQPSPRDTVRALLEEAVRYHCLNQHEAAEVTTRQALKVFRENAFSENDQRAERLYESGLSHLEQEQFERALPFVQAAYKLKQDHRHAFLASLRCLWCLGRYEEFWTLHEDRRLFLDNLIAYQRIYGEATMWNGRDSLEGKRVLVYGEGGAGDQIQFIRYLPLLKKMGCKLTLNCTSSLGSLFELDFVDEIVYKEHVSMDRKPIYDYHLSMMSLPYYLQQWEPVWIGPLFKARRKVDLSSGKLNVGFVLTPNPRTFEAPENIINVSWLKTIMQPEVQFYNLHHEERAYIDGVVDLCDKIHNFADLADYIEAMDLILGVDSAVLHLAGSMCKKTLGLIRKNGNWRWGSGYMTPWYPTIRLIRQEVAGDWTSVFAELGANLINSSKFIGFA